MNWKKVERHCSGVNLFHNGKSANPIAEWQISETNFDGGEIPNFLKGKKKSFLGQHMIKSSAAFRSSRRW